VLRESRIRDKIFEKKKHTYEDYKEFRKNFGFGTEFLPFETETKEERMKKAQKRWEYSKVIAEKNMKRSRSQNKEVESVNSNGSHKVYPNPNQKMYLNPSTSNYTYQELALIRAERNKKSLFH
jgi:hypothetical protein